MNYQDFLARKAQLAGDFGFEPTFMPSSLIDFQAFLVGWAVRKGRAALFEDCGTGKTFQQLVWAQNVVEHENRPILIGTPLSVAQQTVEEGEKFGIEVERSSDGKRKPGSRIVVTNYERLHYFDPDDYAGMVCDESSIIKNFDGARKAEITEFMRRTKYRLLCTATAAPNDYIELGTSSEALGYLGHMDMLATFFKNDEDSIHPAFIGSKWRFKVHAERDFWRWLASWARALRRPSDLGFEDGGFKLPKLTENEIVVGSEPAFGNMFVDEAKTLNEQRDDSKATLQARCEALAERMIPRRVGVAWANLNAEGDLLTELIPGAVQVTGSDPDERKEEVFTDFRKGRISKVVTKAQIAGFGLNWQHCDYMAGFANHSYERYYQEVRRFWRFGQKKPVTADTIVSSAQIGVLKNMRAKAVACDVMFTQLVAEMNNAIGLDRTRKFDIQEQVPSWL